MQRIPHSSVWRNLAIKDTLNQNEYFEDNLESEESMVTDHGEIDINYELAGALLFRYLCDSVNLLRFFSSHIYCQNDYGKDDNSEKKFNEN